MRLRRIRNRHRTCGETAQHIHYTGSDGWPICGVLMQDSLYNGLQRQTLVSRDPNHVTCRRCRASLER